VDKTVTRENKEKEKEHRGRKRNASGMWQVI